MGIATPSRPARKQLRGSGTSASSSARLVDHEEPITQEHAVFFVESVRDCGGIPMADFGFEAFEGNMVSDAGYMPPSSEGNYDVLLARNSKEVFEKNVDAGTRARFKKAKEKEGARFSSSFGGMDFGVVKRVFMPLF